MNTKYIIIVLLTSLSVMLIYLFNYKKKEDDNLKKIEIKDIKSFHLSYSRGYAMNSNIIYDMNINKETDEYVIKIKPYEVALENRKEIIVENNKIRELENILKKHHIENWNGFNKNDPNVLDGDDFSLSIEMNNGNKIHASGYMMWPDGYRDFILEIDEFFMNIYNGGKDEKI